MITATAATTCWWARRRTTPWPPEAAYLFAGPLTGTWTTSDALAAFMGEVAGDNAGQGVAMGDIDADGWSVVLVGAPNAGAGGALYLLWPETDQGGWGQTAAWPRSTRQDPEPPDAWA